MWSEGRDGHPGGGAPVVSSDGGVMFNDILGTTLGVSGNDNYIPSSVTAFGDTINNQLPTSNFFTGKPHVEGLGHVFLLRNYRADLGKWPTADPLGYPDGWNQMAYCGNNSINCYDYLGAKVGDIYPTPDDAAEAWADEFLDSSISDNKEYASYFYKNGDGYSYNQPNIGDEHSVKIPFPSDPSDYEGYIHSHGAESPTYDDDNFSKADRENVNTYGKSGYLVTPSGGLKRLDPYKNEPVIVNNNIRE